MDEVLPQLIKEQIALTQKIVGEIAGVTAAVNAFGTRIERLENALHTPPCRHLERIDNRLSTVEQWRNAVDDGAKQSRGRLSNLFWVLITNSATAGLTLIGTLLALGFKVWAKQ